jgi:hypothetical protein
MLRIVDLGDDRCELGRAWYGVEEGVTSRSAGDRDYRQRTVNDASDEPGLGWGATSNLDMIVRQHTAHVDPPWLVRQFAKQAPSQVSVGGQGTSALGATLRACSADGEDVLEVVGRTRNHMDAYELADTSRGRGSGVSRSLDRTDITPNNRGDEARIDLLPADEDHVRSLDHRIGRLDHADETARLDHPQCFAVMTRVLFGHVRSFGQ